MSGPREDRTRVATIVVVEHRSVDNAHKMSFIAETLFKQEKELKKHTQPINTEQPKQPENAKISQLADIMITRSINMLGKEKMQKGQQSQLLEETR